MFYKKIIAVSLSIVLIIANLTLGTDVVSAEVQPIQTLSQTCVTQSENWSTKTINGDLYIGPNSVLTINGSVTVNGDIYVLGTMQNYGNLKVTGTIHASQFNWGTSPSSNGTVLMLGGTNSIGSIKASNDPIDIPLKVYEADDKNTLIAKEGKLDITGATLPIADLSVEGTKIDYNVNGTFSLSLDVAGKTSITFQITDVNKNKKDIKYNIVNSTNKVFFNSTQGSLVDNQLIEYNAKAIKPADPTRTGYTFAGWYKDATCLNAWDFTTDKVTVDTTVYAKWTANNYTVTLNSQGGSLVSNKSASYNSLITTPVAPTRTGYTFGGWYKEATCSNAWNFTTDKVTANTTIYAKWILIQTGIPTGLKATSTSYSSINVNWSIVTGASGYVIYRALSSTGAYTSMSDTTKITYQSTGLTTNNTYYYKVRSYKMVGKVKVYSGYSAIISSKPILLAPASVKVASYLYNSINVKWGSIAGASKYEVYRATSSVGLYTLVSTTTAISYTNSGLTSNSIYYYKVRAYRLIGKVKVYSAYSSVLSAKPMPATPVAVKAASIAYNSINIRWNAVYGVSGYEVYKATGSKGSCTLVSTTAGLSYNNTGLMTNTSYYYMVRAYRLIGTAKVYSGFSALVSARPIPATPVNFKSTRISSKSIKLTCSAVAGASGYEVYRATSSGGTYSLLTRMTSSYYTNLKLTTGRTYYYKIRSYRIVGSTRVYSNWSAIAHAKV